MPSFGKYQFIKEYLKFKFNHKDRETLANNLDEIRDASFWRSGNFNKKIFYQIISRQDDLNYINIVKLLLESDRISKNKKICGAKFPAHVIYFPFFLRKLKGAKFVLLARDPYEIYKSQINKHNVTTIIRRIMMLLWVSVMFNITMLYAFIYRNTNNVKLINFFDFKFDKRTTIIDLCKFLEIKFQDKMLLLPKKGSSYRNNKKIIDVNRVDGLFIKIFTYPFFLYYKKG